MTLALQQNIFLIGPMGAGKSTIGRQLANELKLAFYDTDQVIEERAGADIPWIYDIEGEDGYRRREHVVLDELSQHKGIVLATGGGIIMESNNRSILASRGIVIYLKTSLEKQLQRTENDRKRPLLQTDNPKEVLEHLRDEREPYYEELADISVSTDQQSIRAVVNEIIEKIEALNKII